MTYLQFMGVIYQVTLYTYNVNPGLIIGNKPLGPRLFNWAGTI